jgi:hypothetical protein
MASLFIEQAKNMLLKEGTELICGFFDIFEHHAPQQARKSLLLCVATNKDGGSLQARRRGLVVSQMALDSVNAPFSNSFLS